MDIEMELTEDEKKAKDYYMLLMEEGEDHPCDTDLTNFEPELPPWYDAVKFKRGQKYFLKNRTPILATNLVGLLSLLAHQKGLQVLIATGRSSTPETAKKRYVSTILTTLCWYEGELSPGSKSWESLMRVRRLHLSSSKLAVERNLHFISQTELTITQFGFMGLAIIRPHLFGIQHDNVDDQEAFIHVWAVLGYMLGIHDKYNMCLLPFETIKIVCQCHLRYLLLPALQLETPDFKKMTEVLLEGLSDFFPYSNYKRYIYMARKSVGVPGYQRKVDLEKEVLCRSIFTSEDIQRFHEKYAQKLGYEYYEFVLFTDIPVFDITKFYDAEINGNDVNFLGGKKRNELIVNGETRDMDPEYAERLRQFLGLDEKDCISLRLINYETEYRSSLNDLKYRDLDSEAKVRTKINWIVSLFSSSIIGKYIMEFFTSIMLYRMRRYLDKAQQNSN